jgi:hypothetical protein
VRGCPSAATSSCPGNEPEGRSGRPSGVSWRKKGAWLAAFGMCRFGISSSMKGSMRLTFVAVTKDYLGPSFGGRRMESAATPINRFRWHAGLHVYATTHSA